MVELAARMVEVSDQPISQGMRRVDDPVLDSEWSVWWP